MSLRNGWAYDDPARQCHGKHTYPSKAIAKRSLKRWKPTGARRNNLQVYRCPHCDSFHIGHKPGTRTT